MRTAVSCGFLTATGGGVVDGVGTIKLSERPGAADQPPGNSTMTFWAKLTVPIPPGFTRVPWGS